MTEKHHVSDLDPRADGVALREVEVPTITLNELLGRNDVRRFDFLSLDIEQAEPAAPAGLDIERFRPELVCIEAYAPIRERTAACLATRGYERIDAYLRQDEFDGYDTPRR